MSYLPSLDLPDTFGPRATLEQRFGLVPAIFRAQGLLPRAIEAEAGIAEAVLFTERGLTRLEKERLLLAISGANRNTYCVTAHGEALRSLGVPDGQIDLMATDHRLAGLSPRDVATLDFALKLGRTPTRITRADVDALRGLGLTDEQILEAVVVTALAEFLCCLSTGLGVAPDSPPRRATGGAVSSERKTGVGPGEVEHSAAPYLKSLPLTEEGFAPFAFFRQKFGFIPNIFRAQTLRPDIVEAETRTVEAVLLTEDVLSRMRKEFILLAVSAANLNTYCVAVHCELLQALGVPAEDSDRIVVDHHRAGLSAADVALLDFALKLARQAADYGRADVDALRRSGFSDVEILEAIVMTALTAFLNTLQMGLGTVPDFEPLRVFRSTDAPTPVDLTGHPTIAASAPDAADAGLVHKARAGDLDAFEELVRRHHMRVFRTLLAMTGRPEDAEDDLQTALLKAYQHIREFEGRSSFSSWLTRIAINETLQRLRGRERADSLSEGGEVGEECRPRDVEAWDDNPEQKYSKKELRELVEREVLRLPPIYRSAVVLRDLQQLSTEETAAALGIEVATLKWRVHQGRLRLREALAPWFCRTIDRTDPTQSARPATRIEGPHV